MAGPALESAHQNDFAPWQAPSVTLAMGARMEQLRAEMAAELLANRATPHQAELMEEAARIVSDFRALLETTLREMHVWAGQPPSTQWASMRLDQAVSHPDIPQAPKSMEPLFAPLEQPAVQGREFTFRQPH